MGGSTTSSADVAKTLQNRATAPRPVVMPPSISIFTPVAAAVSSNSASVPNSMPSGMNPLSIRVRESVSSADCPDPTTLFIGVDVTGSNTRISKQLLDPRSEGSLASLYGFLEDEHISGPQIAIAAIGDSKTDLCPLQVPQFEASAKFADDVAKLYQEAGGGGNGGESYHLAWYFAATKIRLGSMEEKGKKGVIVTVGDEFVHPTLTQKEIRRVIDSNYAGPDLSNEELLAMVKANWEVCHVFINTSQYSGAYQQFVGLLGADHVKVVNTFGQIASAIADLVAHVYPTLTPEAIKQSSVDSTALDNTAVLVPLTWDLMEEIVANLEKVNAQLSVVSENQTNQSANHALKAMLECLVSTGDYNYSLSLLKEYEETITQGYPGWKDTSFSTNASLAYQLFAKVRAYVEAELDAQLSTSNAVEMSL